MMSDSQQSQVDHSKPEPEPADAELEEPSTEKEPAEAPKAPAPDEPEADHRAIGIGVIDGAEFQTPGSDRDEHTR